MKLNFSRSNKQIANVSVGTFENITNHASVDINVNGEWCNDVVSIIKSNDGTYWTNRIRRIYQDGVSKKISTNFRVSGTDIIFKSVKLKNRFQNNIHKNY